jgi:hypothetical protein
LFLQLAVLSFSKWSGNILKTCTPCKPMLIGGIPKKRLVANGRGDHFQNMIPFLIAGGSVVTTLIAPEPVDTINHTLLGVKVKAKEVVTRNMWGTPMMPDGKGSYSLIAPPEPVLIERSLIQPPKTSAPTFEPDKPYPLDSLTQQAEEKVTAATEPTIPVVAQPQVEAPLPSEAPAILEDGASGAFEEPAPAE